MKGLHALILAVSSYLCQDPCTVSAQTVTDSIPYSGLDQDSIPGVILLSADGEENANPFERLIPCTPQAASLARYAEYPVNLTTGIPDITIPLYEIRMGDFTLPISISYHASGARPDDVPSCVGLGWTLNAGGAITRTILGGPDLEVESMEKGDYSYYRMSRIDSLIQDVKKDGGRGHLRELTDPKHYRDSESDRYCFNAGGHVGVFRYSYSDRRYICLDRSSCRIESSGYGESSYFRMYCPDNTTYWFTAHEKTGTDPNLEGPLFTTAWYVSRIDTPYGTINFKYRDKDDRFYVRHTSTYFRSGFYPRYEPPGRENVSTIYQEFHIKSYENSETNMYYSQRVLSSIEWNGHTVEFEYAEGGSDDLNLRLAGMTVKSADGTIVKTVVFGNGIPWKSGTDRGRRVLSGLDDSVEGRYSFTYYTGKALPNIIDSGNPAKYTDSWGYYNGGDGHVLSKDVAEWLRFDFNNKYHAEHTDWRDRSPKLEYARLGVLKTIKFPTGGTVTYDYELNELYGDQIGGLRVAATTLQEVGSSNTRKYRYLQGVTPQMHPDTLSKHLSYLRVENAFAQANTMTLQYRTAYSSPVYSPFRSSAPVLYTKVKEELSDGTYTICEYDAFENDAFPYYSQDWRHPSTFPEALTDRGMNEPVLTSKSRYSASGILLDKVTNTYTHEEISSIETGVRLLSVIDRYIYDEYQAGYEKHEDEFREGVGKEELLVRQTTARQIATVLKSTVTEDFTTGFSTTVSHTYDPQFRTLRPVTETVTNSDGTVHVRRYEYPFHRTGEFYRSMVEQGFADWVLATSDYIGGSLIARNETEYQDDEYPTYVSILPMARRSWSAPTASSLHSPPATLPDRWKVGGYTFTGRPTSIVVNGTDLSSMTWNYSGDLLSFTAPGGLTTTYTQRSLIGITSMKHPNGYTMRYTYNGAGMLASVADDGGAIETYSYSIASHPTASMTGAGNSVTTTRFISTTGPKTVKSRQYLDGLGRPSCTLRGGLAAGKPDTYVYTALSYDALGRESQAVLPSVGSTAMESKTAAQVKALSNTTYSDQYAWSETTYDALDRPVKVATPGSAWHSAGKGKTSQYIANASNSVRLYTAPMTSSSLSTGTYYAEKTLQGVRTVDEDGHEMTVYTDRLGRKVLERRGPESQKGQNDTYFVHNALGQLRFVLSPGYQESASLAEYAYEYRYDSDGNMVYKSVPGAGYTQYWYDRAGRLTYMQDANLRSKSLYRFFLYDKAGRQAIQGVCKTCTRDATVNFASYNGGSGGGGFMSTGYTLTDASRIQHATLETVSYYDAYTFATDLDSDLVKTGALSAKGLQTGSIIYNSDGTKSLSAFYYDLRGNVTEQKEKTSFGTLRTTVNTYTYTGQPLKSTVTEGTVTTVTENVYDTTTGLLTATDVTVNDVKQRVSAVTYDGLGRIASVTRGAGQNSGGTVSYTYNLHGQTKTITGPGFSQELFYADGGGTKLFNGSVSAMTWRMGTDLTIRGYRYVYNGYGWLTSAAYAEGAALTANKDRYTEKSTAFTRNGSITKLQRYGLTAGGTFGKVDDLTVSYSGNRINGVADAAPAVTQNGSMDFPGGTTSKAFGYNAFGALTSDGGRGITSITYDNFGNPLKTTFSSKGYSENVYSATGEKLKTIHSVPVSSGTVTTTARTTIAYRGNVIYRNGAVDMVLFPGGYATVTGGVKFHYYTQDYLGNNRAVINGSTGAIEQTTAYYPYGGIIPDLGTPTTGQPYRFGGKELMAANGLNEYDFGARQYYSAIPGFTKPDQMAGKYPWLSPYLYCANNPVNAFDPDGNIIIFINGMHFGDGGSPNYWNGVDKIVASRLKDQKMAYVDGALGGVSNTISSGLLNTNLKARNRICFGYSNGILHARKIYDKLQDNETIKIITHSMGAAYAKGFVKALLDYANKNQLDPRIMFELDLAPFEWWDQSGVSGVPTFTISHWYDGLAWPAFMKNAENNRTHLFVRPENPLSEHSIDSFSADTQDILDGIIKRINNGEIEFYIDGKKRN